ncbi:hypothetical protein D3C78_1594030 [compost metagenome]
MPVRPDRVVPIALNQPLTLQSGQPLGWVYAGADFAWLTWRGAKDDDTLQKSLSLPGDADEALLGVGSSIVGFPALTDPSLIADELAKLEGMEVVVPIFDQVEGDRFRVSAFGLIRIQDHRTDRLRLKIHYIGRCDPYGRLL